MMASMQSQAVGAMSPVKRLNVLAALLCALALAGPLPVRASQSPGSDLPAAGDAVLSITLKADDGVTVHGRLTQAASPKALILLFHQAGSSKGEYATIAPRLREAGYASLAIDQRSGGSLFGRNETVAAVRGNPSYLDAKRDLAAALNWAVAKHAPVVLWGSSYSAALVFLLAADHPGAIAAVLAFSPGEYLGGRASVNEAARRVRVPVFVTSADTEDEIETARKILASSPATLKAQFVPIHGGVHGSSTLIAARNPSGAPSNWTAVLAFLATAVP